MKLAMRLPEKNRRLTPDADPRDDMPAEVIDLASRTAYPAVAGGRNRSDALGLAGGIGFVALLGAATLWGLNASRTGSAGESAPQFGPTPEQQAAVLPQALPGAPTLDPAPAAAALSDPAPSPVLANPPLTSPGAAANPYSTPTLVFDAGAVAAPAAGVPATEGAASPGSPGAGSAADFASRIGGVGGAPAVARTDVDPKTTVTQGTMIPAILETAIDTDVPGYVRAVVSQDVRSFDGTRVLVPRSSRLIGQYQSGLQGGQKRAYVIWTRLIRPDGVSVSLASPATGFDGKAGLPGEVSSHFFKRFGSAMLLSVIGGLTTLASGGTSVILGGGQSAAATALQQDGQISPTVRVRQGEPIRVFTARDLDFSQAPRL